MANIGGNQIPQIISLRCKWIMGDQLGSGGFGKVHLAHKGDCTQAVAKLIPKDPGAERELLFEELKEVPNVVPILDSGEWGDCWVIVMPRADKSLRDYLGENTEHLLLSDTVKVLSDITKALVAIENRVVHRDIKPENILLLNGRWCLADFGISRYADATTALDTRKHSKTPRYAAPEQWQDERASSATDVYALGVVAYELLAGRPPFLGPSAHEYRQQHLEEEAKPILNIPRNFQSLIAECLYKIPESRPRPRNLLARLESILRPTSLAGSKLQQANEIEIKRRAEKARQKSIRRLEAERRAKLYDAAGQSLENILEVLNDEIMVNAPSCDRSDKLPPWRWFLNGAILSVDGMEMPTLQFGESSFSRLLHSPFEVVACSAISVEVPPNSQRYKGRAHSLWYCDAQEPGNLRWYETAFMFSGIVAKVSSIEPFALKPGEDAYRSLAPIMHQAQVAWPFTTIDQGDEGAFVERWVGWFAEAALGNLQHPSHMPEFDTKGSWRY